MALGEHIDGTPPQAVLDALHQNPAARREADAIRSNAQRLASALGTSGSASPSTQDASVVAEPPHTPRTGGRGCADFGAVDGYNVDRGRQFNVATNR